MGFTSALEVVKIFGLPGLVLLIWWLDQRAQTRALMAYRDDTQAILRQYKEHVDAIAQMYKNNVALVEASLAISKDLREIVVHNTSCWQAALKAIEDNQYCPEIRLDKRARGKEE